MKRNSLWIAAALLLVPALLLAQPGPMHGKKMPAGAKMMLGEKIRSILNEDQLKKWEALRVDFQKKRNELQAKLKNARLDLRQLMKSKRVPDEKKVYAKLDEIQKLNAQLKRMAIAQQLEFRKLITDEQWQKLKELKRKGMAKMMKHRFERRHERRPIPRSR